MKQALLDIDELTNEEIEGDFKSIKDKLNNYFSEPTEEKFEMISKL